MIRFTLLQIEVIHIIVGVPVCTGMMPYISGKKGWSFVRVCYTFDIILFMGLKNIFYVHYQALVIDDSQHKLFF